MTECLRCWVVLKIGWGQLYRLVLYRLQPSWDQGIARRVTCHFFPGRASLPRITRDGYRQIGQGRPAGRRDHPVAWWQASLKVGDGGFHSSKVWSRCGLACLIKANFVSVTTNPIPKNITY
jgi:hypothetical protein